MGCWIVLPLKILLISCHLQSTSICACAWPVPGFKIEGKENEKQAQKILGVRESKGSSPFFLPHLPFSPVPVHLIFMVTF